MAGISPSGISGTVAGVYGGYTMGIGFTLSEPLTVEKIAITWISSGSVGTVDIGVATTMGSNAAGIVWYNDGTNDAVVLSQSTTAGYTEHTLPVPVEVPAGSYFLAAKEVGGSAGAERWPYGGAGVATVHGSISAKDSTFQWGISGVYYGPTGGALHFEILNAAGALTRVDATQGTTWNVLTRVATTQSTTWNVAARPTSQALYQAYVLGLTPAPWAYYPLESDATDATANGRDLTVNGTAHSFSTTDVWASDAGKIVWPDTTSVLSNAYIGNFNAGSDHIWAVIGWYKFTETDQVAIWRISRSNGDMFDSGYRLSGTDGALHSSIYSGTDGGGGAISLDVWHHLAIVNDNSVTRLYIDGVKVADYASTAGQIEAGKRWWPKQVYTSDSYPPFEMADVALWLNGVPDESQVVAMYAASVAERVTKAIATTWNVDSSTTRVDKTQSTTWQVTARVAKTQSTTWDVLTLVPRVDKTQGTSWNVSARVVKTQVITWDVLSLYTRVDKVQSTTWNVRQRVQTTVDTTWDTAELVTRVDSTRDVLWNVLVLGAPPANDDFSGIITLSGDSGVVSFDNEAATAEVDDPVFLSGNKTIWYSWTASASGIARFTTGPDRLTTTDTSTPHIDTRLGVYTGSALISLAVVGQNDNTIGTYNGNISEVIFNATEATTYIIAVDATSDDPGMSYTSALSNSGFYNYGPGTLTWDLAPTPAIEFTAVPVALALPGVTVVSLANAPEGDLDFYWDGVTLLETITVDASGVVANETISLPTTDTAGAHVLTALSVTDPTLSSDVTITVLLESEDDVPVDPIFPEPVPQEAGVIKWVFQDPTVYTTNEKQSVYFSTVGVNRPASGQWKLTVSGNETVAMPFNATAGQIQSSIVNLANMGQYDVLVSGGPINHRPVTIEWVGAFARTNMSESHSDWNTLAGTAAPYTVNVDTLQEGNTLTAADPSEYIFPINPHAMTSPFGPKNIITRAAIGPTGQKIAWEGSTGPAEWSFEGDVFSQEMYDNLTLWSQKGNRVFLTDHYQRRWTVYVSEFNPVPKRSQMYPWRHTYTMKVLIFSGPDFVA